MSETTHNENDSAQTIPTPSDELSSLGDIRINNSVVKNIVRLASLEVQGVYAVGGSFVDGLAEMFGNRDPRGVEVSEDDGGNYVIEIAIVVRFGCELAKTAVQVQQNVREQVQRMTMKNVSKVDVTIEGIRVEEPDHDKARQEWGEQTTIH